MELCQVGSNYGLDVNQDFIRESLWSPHAKNMVCGIQILVTWSVKVSDLHTQSFIMEAQEFMIIVWLSGECIVPVNLTNLELNHDNSTRSRIFFHCKDGFIPKDEQTAVCSSNGTWFPDIAQYECECK